MYEGSCLCGLIKYVIEGEIGNGYYCHCNRCRKASGSAFASNAVISPGDFKIISGEELLKTYFNEDTGLMRKFCSNCGSPIISYRPKTDVMAVRLGTIDSPSPKGPVAHIFVGSKAEWVSIADNLPCFNERPEG